MSSEEENSQPLWVFATGALQQVIKKAFLFKFCAPDLFITIANLFYLLRCSWRVRIGLCVASGTSRPSRTCSCSASASTIEAWSVCTKTSQTPEIARWGATFSLNIHQDYRFHCPKLHFSVLPSRNWWLVPVRFTSWHPKFNGSHFGLPPSSIHSMAGPGGKFVWTTTFASSLFSQS